MTLHGIAHHRVQLRERIGLREDRPPKHTCGVATLLCLLHDDDHHGHPCLPRSLIATDAFDTTYGGSGDGFVAKLRLGSDADAHADVDSYKHANTAGSGSCAPWFGRVRLAVRGASRQ
jgi:hypothetical protein